MPRHLKDVVITDKQAEFIELWMKENSKASMLGGYALGESYIDSRANSGPDIEERRRYVKIDHEVARLVPELRGFSSYDIREFLLERETLTASDDNSGFHP